MKKWWMKIKSHWWLLPLVVLIGFGIHRIVAYAKLESKLLNSEQILKDERAQWDKERKLAKQRITDIQDQYKEKLATAESRYNQEVKSFVPLVITNEKVVREYAQTSAGRTVCLDRDGVRRLSEARIRLTTYHPASAP